MRPSICPLCEATCGILVDVEDGRPVGVRGDPDDPLSRGYLCPKATALVDLHADPDRLRHPVRRTASGWQQVGWDEALDEIADRMHALQSTHGRRALAVYLGNPNVHNLGQMTFAPMFWRVLGGTRFSATSADQLPHQLVAYLMLGHQLRLPVPDVDHTELFVVIGANPLVSNGSLMTAPGMRKRLDALRARGGRLVVVDPRRTETAERASSHLPIRPGTDAAWLAALVREVLVEHGPRLGRLEGQVVGLDGLRAAVEPFSADAVAELCGIDAATTRRLAADLVRTERAVVYGRMGASTQLFGALAQWLVVALNAVTGHLDREGGAMFAEPAFDPIAPPFVRGVGPGGFGRFRSRVRGRPEFAGELPVSELATEILTPGAGQIRGLVTWAGNPVLSTPNGAQLDRALASLDLCVAVDFYVTETSRHAHFVLPPVAPLARPHYDIVFHQLAVRNTARFADAVVHPDGETREDWRIALALARRLLRRRGGSWRERATLRAAEAVGPVRVLDMGLRFGRAGLSVARLRAEPSGVDLGPLRPNLVERGGRVDLAPAVLVADVPRLLKSVTAEREPLVLIGRRDLRTNNSWLHNAPKLMKGGSRFTLLMHPEDAARRGLVDGAMAEVRSRVGAVRAPVEVTDAVMAGVVSLPHGWGHRREGVGWTVAAAAGGGSVNDVTDDERVDELCGTAAFSGTPVSVRIAGSA